MGNRAGNRVISRTRRSGELSCGVVAEKEGSARAAAKPPRRENRAAT